MEVETEPAWLRGKNQEIKDYWTDITNYVNEKENQPLLCEDYMSWQTDINLKMRDMLLSWMISIHDKFNLSKATLYLATSILDRYCYDRNILRKRYQLLGGTALFIAAKY